MPGDLADDCLERLLDEQLGGFDALNFEATANASATDNLIRNAAARKFNQEDPIEAASVETILRYKATA